MDLDTQVNLSLKIEKNIDPVLLSDFSGGTAEFYDGYSTTTIEYSISQDKVDPRRLVLTSDGGHEIKLGPSFNRVLNPVDPRNQLEEIPLKIGQDLYDYRITNTSW
ncbi:hypothetical protein ACMXYN_08430 [Neptuniibacter sp. PT8_73]|uniref:hypothetical protein n=1 Tax=Neptuniibacter sp. PT8_73 TaxID=3398206 RepID=UPI0039F4E476